MEINIREKVKAKGKTNDAPAIDPDSLVPFKINIGENEQVARNALTLPYEKLVASFKPSRQRAHIFLNFFSRFFLLIRKPNEPPVAQIFYQPDSDDDFDDEDPDEDLDF